MKWFDRFSDTSLVCAVICGVLACAPASLDAPQPKFPVDQPFRCGGLNENARLDELVQPYIERARQTYPDAKARYLRGLPMGNVFFLTTFFHHSERHREQVFIKVSAIYGEVVSGVIATTPMGPGFKFGQPYEFRETELLDWTIQHPDGIEEGNFVGKFLDRYRGQCPH